MLCTCRNAWEECSLGRRERREREDGVHKQSGGRENGVSAYVHVSVAYPSTPLLTNYHLLSQLTDTLREDMHSTDITMHVRGSGRGCVSEWQWVRRGVEGGGGCAQYRYNYTCEGEWEGLCV